MTDGDAAVRSLSQSALNRALLARQLLLERAELPLVDAVRQMGFVQAQYAPSMYIGLWSRVAGFRRRDLDRALEDRLLVQGTLLRATIHLVPSDEWWPVALAIREHRRRWWLRAHRHRPAVAAEVESAAARVRDVLRAGPRRRATLTAQLELDSVAWNGVNLWLDLVRVPPSGTWEHRRADLYALAEDWIGPPPPGATPDAGLELLLRRYLAGFGPAPLRDAASWAGVPVTALGGAAGRLALRRFRDEAGGDLVDVRDGPLPDEAAPAPVRFLPTWDAALLVHARRTGILRQEHRPLLFSAKSPQSTPAFLVDGEVAGTWRFERAGVLVDPFAELPATARTALDAEAAGLVELLR